jgi:predicted transcriptional regulator
MDWGSLFVACYLLFALFTAAVTARPIRAVMGSDRTGSHADDESAQDARMVVLFIVLGVAAIWPLTLCMYMLSRLIPSSSEDIDDDYHGVEYLLAERTE